MFCSACGKQIAADSKFCSYCGARQNAVGASPSRTNRISNQCDACGAVIKQIRPGHYLCDYCGSEYMTNEQQEITGSVLTDKEVLDIYYQAAQHEVRNEYYAELQCFLRAIEKAPENVTLLVKLGRAYRRNQMLDKARECYQKAITLKPDYAVAYTNLGAVYLLSNQFAFAEPYYRQGIALMEKNPLQRTQSDYAVALGNYAMVVGKLGRLQEAKALLAQAEANGYPNGDTIRKNLGIRKGLFG